MRNENMFSRKIPIVLTYSYSLYNVFDNMRNWMSDPLRGAKKFIKTTF